MKDLVTYRAQSDPRAFHGRLSSPVFSWTGLILVTLFVISGCGKSDKEASTVVSTPDPVGDTELLDAAADSTRDSTFPNAPSNDEGPPGELELPTEVDLSAPAPSASTTAGEDETGFELPDGVAIPASNDTPADATQQNGSDHSNEQTSSDTIQIHYADWSTIKQRAISTGKVTVVDLWSLGCEPCMKEFPGLVELQNAHQDQVQCIAVNIDYDGRKTRPPQYYRDRVYAFLVGVDASSVLNFICETPSDDVYAQTKLPSIPAVLIFDRQGDLVKTFVDAGETKGFGYEQDVVPFVKQLLSS